MPGLTFEQYDMSPDPEQLQSIYDSGFQGTIPDRYSAMFTSGLDSFYQCFPRARGAGKGQISIPYINVLEREPSFGRYEKQTTGDCVSHAVRNAGMLDYCTDAKYGETDYEGRFATENIYGDRGHGGQGASCGRLANYVSQNGKGGFLVRKKYGSVDLSVYNSRTGANWGRSGTPGWLNKIAAKNKALRVMRCKSVGEARDAIATGMGLARCGWWGYSNRRDENGVADVQGKWAHAMAGVGCDDSDWSRKKYDGSLFLILNSWGKWNGGKKRLEQPDGSFWVRERHLKAEIDQGGVYIIASVRGINRELVYDTMHNVAELATAL